jgi:Zn-dependent M28 family amino/carboxypeptidase
MTNIWEETSDLMAIGARHSLLEEIIAAVAARHGMTVSPESAPEQGYFFRSDQFSFALAGIPAVWFDAGDTPKGGEPHSGAHHMQDYRANRYHRPSDEFSEDWPLAATVQVARLAVEVIADIDRLGMNLSWKPGAAFKRP